MITNLIRKLGTKAVIGAALLAPALLIPAPAHAQLAINIRIGPPVLPVYAQPICPGDGYIWTPGYWAYGPEGYYWIPGTWVLAPTPGFLWTPAYWGFENGFYLFHAGYWGPHIGFYGGINYGFGYFGHGFEGGEWRGNHFFYNTAVGNFGGAHVTNVYVRNVTVVNNTRVSFNGAGGIQERPRPEEMQAERERHIQPTQMQQQHFQAAAQDRGQLASVNGGRPQMAAARTPQEFTQHVNAIPQAQRVAPGAPGERFHPNAQPAGQPQNRMQPVVPQQQRIANQPQPQSRPETQPRQQPQPQVRPQEQARPQPRPQEQHPREAPHEERPR